MLNLNKGWIVYADLSDKFIVAKTFTVFEGASYPDNGCRVSVYVGPPDPSYLEFEVKGPTVELAANGGRYTFTENWWAATVRAPVLDVDSVGAIAERMAYDSTSQQTHSSLWCVLQRHCESGVCRCSWRDSV